MQTTPLKSIITIFLLLLTISSFPQKKRVPHGRVISNNPVVMLAKLDSNFTGIFRVDTDPTKQSLVIEQGKNEHYFVADKNNISCRNLDSAYAAMNPVTGKYEIRFVFNKKGAAEVSAFTGRNIMQKAGLIVKGKLYVVAIIYEKITGGQLTLTPNLPLNEVTAIAEELNMARKGGMVVK